MPHNQVGSALESALTGLQDAVTGVLTLPFQVGGQAAGAAFRPLFEMLLTVLLVIGGIFVLREVV